VELSIAGYANSLGTNVLLPNYTILRRQEFGDNVTVSHGHHNMRVGFEELIRGNHTESHISSFPDGLCSVPFPALC
jgi:hypothetical protein